MTTFEADDRERYGLEAAREEIRHLRRGLSTRPAIDQCGGSRSRPTCAPALPFGTTRAQALLDVLLVL
jgi:hypothetical protein